MTDRPPAKATVGQTVSNTRRLLRRVARGGLGIEDAEWIVVEAGLLWRVAAAEWLEEEGVGGDWGYMLRSAGDEPTYFAWRWGPPDRATKWERRRARFVPEGELMIVKETRGVREVDA